ncbi:MAG: prepilin-type N-terminal cleavage/methylation domain-containing protein, partial [Anaerolineae bacterium]|nr:prepilin-type N-terminal cleavage/methylation domain-containing protein [Anaerolineae bacterium]NIN97515.1 prepilin-type N-terminal cleavage/methylation domain-containing protein [Anaerolineae bacterium]NIQ80445.1 prepilin-type N-terminal cleavage/methylation domain-containing protein [Anaerolineae bacterium]
MRTCCWLSLEPSSKPWRGKRAQMTRRRGFTLIELLVVIAIIGILASMVFPVFARARESARKAVCLSNVKNLALALQMYLTDNNDRFPPQNTQAGAEDMLVVAGMYGFGYVCDTQQDNMNPYLRWPVLLEEYTKNREVWACPSAIVESATGVIIPNTYTGGWLGWWEVAAGSGVGYPCDPAFPS